MMKIICVYKNYALDVAKEDDSQYYRCELIGNVFSKPRTITNDSLEIIVAFFKSHVDNFKTGITSPFVQLEVRYRDEVLRVTEYDPNINEVISYKSNYSQVEREKSLNSLVSQFKEWVDEKYQRDIDNTRAKLINLESR